MGRSNSAARQRNTRGRMKVSRGGEVVRRSTSPSSIPRVPLEELVMPDGRCTRNPRKPKDIFMTREKAERALAQAQRQRARVGSGHVEKRFYLCETSEGGCGGYHLTSRDSYDPKTNPRRDVS